MALTRITRGVIKPNENYDTHNIVSTGIVTSVGLDVNGNADVSGSLSVGGVLTYEDVTSIDSIGIITARSGIDADDFISVGSNIHLGNAGVITATSFVGSGAALTGIDATAIKDSGGNVKVQAQASGAVYTGIHTFNSDIDVDGHTNLDNVSVGGATTMSGDLMIDSPSGQGLITIQGTSPRIAFTDTDHNPDYRMGNSNGQFFLYDASNGKNRFTVYNNIFSIPNGTNLDVDGHTNLDNVSVAGVTTFTDNDIDFKNNGITSCRYDSSHGNFLFNHNGGLFWYKNGNLSNSSGASISYSEFSNQYAGLVIQAPWQGQNNAKNIKVMGSSNGYFSIQNNLNGSETFRAIFEGGVNLAYYQSGTKLQTTTTGVTLNQDLTVNRNALITGISTFTGAIDANGDLDVDGHTNLDNVSVAGITTFADNAKAIFGTGGDMQIFHDGTNSRIENDATNLFLQSQLINLANHDGSEVMINANANGAVNLYHDNSKKFETTSYGAAVTGGINFSGDSLVQDNVSIFFGASNDLQIVHDGTNSIIDTNTGDLILRGDSDDVKILAEDDIVLRDNDDSTNFIHCVNGGGVKLYNNGTQMFETYSSGVTISGGQVNVNPSSGNATLQLKSGSGSVYTNIHFKASDNTQTSYITSWSGGNLYFNTTSALISSIGGTEITEVTSTGFHPKTDSARDLGKTGTRWANAYVDTYYGDGSNLTGITGTTINNNADNRVITGSGSANTLNGESNVIIDSSGRLLIGTTTEGHPAGDKITVADSGNAGITIRSGTTSNGALYFSDGTSGAAEYRGGVVYHHDGNYLRFYTNGTERFRIDAAGQVLPGTDDSQNLGSSSKRWANIYAADMHFSNKGKTNDVDGTWGDWTLQEGEDSVYMINNRTGKKYAITMKEVN